MLNIFKRLRNLWNLSGEPSIKDLLKKGYKVTDQFGNTYEGDGIEPHPQAKPNMAKIIRMRNPAQEALKNEQ